MPVSFAFSLLPLVLLLLLATSPQASLDVEEYLNPIVSCETTQGLLRIEIYEDWAPLGAARFLELVADGFYTDIAFFRCVDKFLTQFGISEDPKMKHWHK